MIRTHLGSRYSCWTNRSRFTCFAWVSFHSWWSVIAWMSWRAVVSFWSWRSRWSRLSWFTLLRIIQEGERKHPLQLVFLQPQKHTHINPLLRVFLKRIHLWSEGFSAFQMGFIFNSSFESIIQRRTHNSNTTTTPTESAIE